MRYPLKLAAVYAAIIAWWWLLGLAINWLWPGGVP